MLAYWNLFPPIFKTRNDVLCQTLGSWPLQLARKKGIRIEIKKRYNNCYKNDIVMYTQNIKNLWQNVRLYWEKV